MSECPFCGKYIEQDYLEVCDCGEKLPRGLFKYRREKCLCGKTVPFRDGPSLQEEHPQWETD